MDFSRTFQDNNVTKIQRTIADLYEQNLMQLFFLWCLYVKLIPTLDDPPLLHWFDWYSVMIVGFLAIRYFYRGLYLWTTTTIVGKNIGMMIISYEWIGMQKLLLMNFDRYDLHLPVKKTKNKIFHLRQIKIMK